MVSKKLSGEITETEIGELNDALLADPGLHPVIAILEQSWQAPFKPGHLSPQVVQRILHKIELAETQENAMVSPIPIAEAGLPKRSPLFTKAFWFTAAAVLVMALGLWGLFKPNKNTSLETPQPNNEVTTKAGSKTRIILPDGTLVWLNGDSKLTYTSLFKGKNREVNLSGEAFFEVVSNKQRPFIIHGQKITITVTGTTFNVRDYPEESKAETSLISGKVEVSSNKNPEKIYYLKPTEKIVFKDEIKQDFAKKDFPKNLSNLPLPKVDITPIQIDEIDGIPVETAWVNNQLAFSNETFREVANKMEKWYGVRITFKSQFIEKQRLNGKFEKESLTEALDALQYTTPFGYEITNKEILIYKK